jgi:hypothetical protein
MIYHFVLKITRFNYAEEANEHDLLSELSFSEKRSIFTEIKLGLSSINYKT